METHSATDVAQVPQNTQHFLEEHFVRDEPGTSKMRPVASPDTPGSGMRE
jgi:hypothetical protein